MPRTRATAAAAKPAEPVKPTEPEEQVELDETEETMEEEVEYEEVEEEVEEEEEEEEEEEVVEEPEKEEAPAANGAGDDGAQIDENESKKHDKLLALPPHGSEVFIGGIPHDASEEDLKSFCEPVGEVFEVRVMANKGFSFVTFKTKELAAKAIEDLNSKELKGKKVNCSQSQAKNRLFIGNIPRKWTEDELGNVVTKVGPGATKLDLMMDPHNSSGKRSCNRGFAFVEYYNHACADYARKKMSNQKFKLDNNPPTVSWADPKSGDSSSNSQVKSVYVKNLPKDVTQDQLKKLFEDHGEVTNVVLPPAKSGQEKQRFGFVHFADRSAAMKALQNTEKYEIDGQVLECSLAKPPADKKGDSGSRNRKGAAVASQTPRAPRVGYNYGAQGFPQPMMYGRGQAPVGMAMVPMILPDGRLAYVMQQPGIPVGTPPPRSGSGWGGNSSSGRKSNDKNRGGRRHHPY